MNLALLSLAVTALVIGSVAWLFEMLSAWLRRHDPAVPTAYETIQFTVESAPELAQNVSSHD
ncbi:MAG TPA: hypothetical protein VGQ71_04175 [Terriglobales bacterium]|nr:hypothetical protein [Terriglobales bacterium]